jgi:hypothetical protein
MFFIEVLDWRRLQKFIRRIAPPTPWYQIGGSVFAGGAIATIISVTQAEAPTYHFKVVSWAAVIGCGVLAVALFGLDKLQRQDIAASTEFILEEMLDIENKTSPAPAPEPASGAASSAGPAAAASAVGPVVARADGSVR